MLALLRIAFATTFMLFIVCNFIPWFNDHDKIESIKLHYGIRLGVVLGLVLDALVFNEIANGSTPFHVSEVSEHPQLLGRSILAIALFVSSCASVALGHITVLRIMTILAAQQQIFFLLSVYYVKGKRPFCPTLAPASPTSDAKKEE